MDFILFWHILGCAAAGVGLCILNRYMAKRIEAKTVKDLLNAFTDVAEDVGKVIADQCSNCSRCSGDGMCDEPDYQNLVDFGKCTRFEEKRF